MLHKYLFRFTPRQRDISHYLIVAFPFGWTGGPARSFPCWVDVLEQVSPAGSTWKLTWSPVSVPVALAPGGSARSFPCWAVASPVGSTWNLT